jgi:shikimate dehydrogenase
MHPDDPLPVDVDDLSADQLVACVVTRPEITAFIAASRRSGCATVTGSDMFVAQEALLVDALVPNGSEGR